MLTPEEIASLKPSDFWHIGHPSLSNWYKYEAESLAHAYVAAMAIDGDTWKPMTAERCLELLRERGTSGGIDLEYLRGVTQGYYKGYWQSVTEALVDPKTTIESVGGFWSRVKPHGPAVKTFKLPMGCSVEVYTVTDLTGEKHVTAQFKGTLGYSGGYNSDDPAHTFCEALERLCAAHACAGIDIGSEAYLKGLNEALQYIPDGDE